MSRRNVSALERLRVLPDVFTSNMLGVLQGLSEDHVNTMISSWRKVGLVQTMGMRKAGVHYNLLRDPEGPQRRKGEALWLLLNAPSVTVGEAALNAGGWTTQMAHRVTVCTGVTPRLPTVPSGLDGIDLMPRPAAWMYELLTDAIEHGELVGDVLCASPAMALADTMLANARRTGEKVGAPMPWLPDPDDLEIPEEADLDRVRNCLKLLGATAEEMEMVEPYAESIEAVSHYARR